MLVVKYTPVAPKVGRAIGGFLKYVQHRDQHDNAREVQGLLKYVSYRYRSAAKGLLFGPDGRVGDYERKQLAAFIGRSVEGSKPQLARNAEGQLVDRRRAAYRFVLSPEKAEGLDLKQLTRAALRQFEADAGGLGPWLAAEHRNTAHPHIHIVLAARRQVGPDQYRSVMLTRPRLERMKEAVQRELDRQRGRDLQAERPSRPAERQLGAGRDQGTPRRRQRQATLSRPTPRLAAFTHGRSSSWMGVQLRRLARDYRREAEREAERRLREREQEWER